MDEDAAEEPPSSASATPVPRLDAEISNIYGQEVGPRAPCRASQDPKHVLLQPGCVFIF
jgi:hypothetical protein